LRDPEAALPSAQRAVELDGASDAGTLETLALAYRMTGDLDRAISTQRSAVALARAGGAYNRPELEGRLMEYLLENGDFVGAASVSWEDLATQLGESLMTETAPRTSDVLRSEALMRDGRFEEAADVLRTSLVTRQKTLPEGHLLIADTMSRLGGAVAGQGKLAEAEPMLLEGYAMMRENRRATASDKREAIERIVQLYESWGKAAQAAEWRERLAQVADDMQAED
jgi:tetratricopeptide (TPR) repeat protein